LVTERPSTETDESESLWQQVANPEVKECGHNLAVREVTRCAEEDHHMRIRNALNAQPCAQWILCPPLCRRLSRLAAEPQITNCRVPLSGRLWAHSDFTEWPPN
jgi:hypothetical protein